MRHVGISRHGGAAFTAVLGICAASLAWAQDPLAAPHTLNVALPDGGVAQITYVGSVPPRLVVAPADEVAFSGQNPFALMDRLAAEMDAQAAGLMRQAALVDAAAMPAGLVSTSYVATFNGGAFCARSTQVTSAGPGMRPQIVSQVSGSCGPEASAPARSVRVRDDDTEGGKLRPAVLYTPAD